MADSVKSWSENDAQAALKQLRKIKRPARQTMSTRQALYTYYMPIIVKWLDEGWRYDEVVTALNEQGIQTTRSTLYSYVRDFRQQQAKTVDKTATTSTNQGVPNDGTAEPMTRRRARPKVDDSANAEPGMTQRVSGDTAASKSPTKKKTQKTLVDTINEGV